MSKIFNLTYNEILKQIKKTSIKVIIALILILSIVLPLINNIVKSQEIDYNKTHLYNANSRLNHINQEINKLKSDKTEKGRVLKNNLELQKVYVELEKVGKVTYSDWRENEINNHNDVYAKVLAIKEVLNDINKETLITNVNGVDPAEIEKYYKLPREDLKKELILLENKLEEIKNIVVKKDYIKYLENHITSIEKLLGVQRKQLEEHKKQLEVEPNKENIKEDIKYLIQDISRSEIFLSIDKYRLANKIDFSKSNWKNNTLNNIKEDMENLNKKMMSENEFNKNALSLNIKMNYDEYKKEYKRNFEELKNNIKINWYSLEKNIPQLENTIKDGRSALDQTYNIYILLVSLLLIIIGGGIIATEFSKGTIRLLLIRPVSRGKILFSKLLALLIIGYGIILGAVIVSAITSGIVFGFNTFNIPILKVVSEKVVQVSFIQYLIPNILIASTSLIFITSLVFMLSTITKNIAVSVATSTIVYLGAMPLTVMLIGLNINWLSNTFISYINQSLFSLMPSFVEIIKSQNGIRFDVYSGGIQLIIISVIMILISFIVFNKKDIKN